MSIAARLGRLALRVAAKFARDRASLMAAAISYYVLFSIFPLLIFLAGGLGLFLDNTELREDLVDAIMEALPLDQDEGRNDVARGLREIGGQRGGALGLLGLAGMAWAASSMFGAIRTSLNAVFAVQTPRPLLQQKLVDLAMVALLAPLFIAAVALTAGLRFVSQIADSGLAEELARLWFAVSLLLPLALSFVAFLLLYWRVPARALPLRELWPGALTAAVLFQAANIGFNLYLQNVAGYDIVFGPLGAVVAFLFGIYVSSTVLLLGAEIGSLYVTVMGEEPAPAADCRPRAVPLSRQIRRFLRGLVLSERERKLP
jgi:membrane protein